MTEIREKADYTRWMTDARVVAEEALPEDVPVGALLVRDDKILASACNRRERDCDPTAHAEMLALRKAGKQLGDWRLTDTVLYVTLEPCPMCASAILQARVSKIVFGAYDPVAGACGSVQNVFSAASGVEVVGGILEEECAGLLREFFKKTR